jgi:single-stranded-DNA-specific exonuclease
MALRAELRARGWAPLPDLRRYLDLVALGTVADVVRLDANNRTLVAQGLARIRAGRASPGIAALLEVAGRDARCASAYDLGFAVGPRLNAAGRLDDMSLGIECLIAGDRSRAMMLAQRLDALNRERREIEGGMQESALAMGLEVEAVEGFSLVVHRAEWHPGVVGLLASRLREKFHRPVFAFARDGETLLRGSGRSIPSLHLRDALDLVQKRSPGMLERFGGHAAAAGATLRADALASFREAFEAVARERLTRADLDERIETDGELAADELTFEFARLLRDQVWGQGFPEPRFFGRFAVEEQRIVGEKHLRVTLVAGGRRLSAMRFGSAETLPPAVEAVYRLDVNEFQGTSALRIVLDYVK